VPTWLIIVIVVLLVLAVGGSIARRAQLARSRSAFDHSLERVNHDLAEAAAQDRGWDRSTLEAAARRAFAQERGAEPDALTLVEVLDRPGTDDDRAVFRAEQSGAAHALTLGRREGEWIPVSLEPERARRR
jgi:Tfp pilus assembly protein PilX